MNLPNKITVLRLALVPAFVLAFQLPSLFGDSFTLISVISMVLLYILIELSDLADGIIARNRNLVTDLGKVMDPFADTLAHVTFFICFYGIGIMPFIPLIFIVWREFSILFVRMLLMKKGKAMPANMWGKSKTVLYAVVSILSIIYLIANQFFAGDWLVFYSMFLNVMFYLAAVASVVSFAIYVKDVFKTKALAGMTY